MIKTCQVRVYWIPRRHPSPSFSEREDFWMGLEEHSKEVVERFAFYKRFVILSWSRVRVWTVIIGHFDIQLQQRVSSCKNGLSKNTEGFEKLDAVW